MRKIVHLLFPLFLLAVYVPKATATHALGGEITWFCQGGGNYVFELKFYRDCNGFEVNTNFETLEVWGHPTVTSVQVDFVSRVDISPACTAAAGNVPFDCGTGVGGGNGVGAVEEITYRSSPISISGVPPTDGWHFTYQNFSRSGNITNLTTPSTYGITLTATMFPIPGATGGCIDNSPTFLQSPYIISCAGDEYNYNPNGVDVDLDSLNFSWAKPLDYFPSGGFNPPTNPGPVPFEPGFSFDNPTPDASFNAGNQAATIDPNNGAVNFTSFTQGNFATKIKATSYRNGVKIAEVEREIQVITSNCNGTNNPPSITPPFNGGTSFETDVYAGDLVSFDVTSTDVENLQDGSPQSNTISATGLLFGTNFNDPTSGCQITPCATLSSPSVTSTNGATLSFDWQTSCDHLVGATGNAQNSVPYIFVFKVTDDYCPIPKVRYATVTVNVLNKDVLAAPNLTCLSTNTSNDVVLTWDAINDPTGNFNGYEIFGVNSGSVGTVSNINTTTFTIPGAGGTGTDSYYVASQSGCNGNTLRYSDTLKNIFLTVNNPGNGEAILQWNTPHSPKLPWFDNQVDIYKEFPAGTWTKIASVPYSTTSYKDTITVCEEQINYRIKLETDNCTIESNIDGDLFEDQIVPDIPVIGSVSIDTSNSEITLTWDENSQDDTYGYVIYQVDGNGNLVEIDTVWGKGNTSFSHFQDISNGAYEYSVAAFDSCYTSNVPPTYQTSAKASTHTTNFLTSQIDVCNRMLNLNWTGYIGYDTIANYIVFTQTNGGIWQQTGQTTDTLFSENVNIGDTVLVTIKTIASDGRFSFSNVDTALFQGNVGPSIAYLSVATVQGDQVAIKQRLSYDGGVETIQLERFNTAIQDYEVIDKKTPGNSTEIIFKDKNAEVNRRSYTYRTRLIDTCDQEIEYSNLGKTIYLNVKTVQEEEVHVLEWTPYQAFLGYTMNYKVYRSINGNFDSTPIATLPYNQRTYTDSVTAIGNNDDGKICYFIEATEGSNQYGWEEKSYSNVACGIIQPTIYIPNAFTVGGKNPIFKPETRQRQYDNYKFEVYDRYGRIVFETNDPEEGWNGQLKGQTRYAAEGVYVYRLSIENGDGIAIIKHGHVTLLDYRGVE